MAEAEALRDAFAAGRLDLAIGDPAIIGGTPRKRRAFRLAWAAAPEFDATRDPFPLVLFRHPCEWRVRTINALDHHGRRWRAAFESGSLTAIQAAVRSGVGAATLLLGNVETGMAVLEPSEHNLPPAPQVELGLYRRPGLRGDNITDRLESLLGRALG